MKKAIHSEKNKKTGKSISKPARVKKTVKTAKPAIAGKVVKAKAVTKADKTNKLMVQHLFKLQCNYKAPDGRVFRVVVSEVYNLRCFEVVNGNLVGRMIKIHPTSELAKSLVEVTGSAG